MFTFLVKQTLNDVNLHCNDFNLKSVQYERIVFIYSFMCRHYFIVLIEQISFILKGDFELLVHAQIALHTFMCVTWKMSCHVILPFFPCIYSNNMISTLFPVPQDNKH